MHFIHTIIRTVIFTNTLAKQYKIETLVILFPIPPGIIFKRKIPDKFNSWHPIVIIETNSDF